MNIETEIIHHVEIEGDDLTFETINQINKNKKIKDTIDDKTYTRNSELMMIAKFKSNQSKKKL